MLGISTRFLFVWDDRSEYLKTMYFILLVRWQKPGIVYPEHNEFNFTGEVVKARNSLSWALVSGLREVSLSRKARKHLPDAEHYFTSISVKGKKVSKCLEVPEMRSAGICISNCRIHTALYFSSVPRIIWLIYCFINVHITLQDLGALSVFCKTHGPAKS